MKLNYIKVLPFCMLLSLGFGACSSDDAVEEMAPIEENNEVFSTLKFNLGTLAGDYNGSKQEGKLARNLSPVEGNVEDGWTSVNPADPSPSQNYPLNEIYVFCRQATDAEWDASQDIEVLKYNLDDNKAFEMLYLAKGNVITLKGITGKLKSTSDKGLDIMFVSQKSNIFKTPIHTDLRTPNGKEVYAACGDVLFRSKEYTVKSENSKVIVKERGANDPQAGEENVFNKDLLVMYRGTCSYNSKLIITDKTFGEYADDVESGKKPGHGCHWSEIWEEIIENLLGCHRCDGSQMSRQEAEKLALAYEGALTQQDFLDMTDTKSMNDWQISTFIAPSRGALAKANYPFPNKYNFFAYKPSDKLVAGQAVFDGEGGITALTKKERAFVSELNYPGYPIDYPAAEPGEAPKPVNFFGVGKDFNFVASPYIFPFLTDGAYDLCFSVKQYFRNGSYKQATFRFPIVNADMAGNGQDVQEGNNPEGEINPERLVTANRNIYTTIVLDINDFVAQWNNIAVRPGARGVMDNVIDLESNVIEVPYKMF